MGTERQLTIGFAPIALPERSVPGTVVLAGAAAIAGAALYRAADE